MNPNFKIYRDSFFFQIREVSHQVFRITRKVYESKFRMKSWDVMCEDYIRKNPPRDPRLAWALEKFPEKLPTEDWVKELAHYEWIRFQVIQGDSKAYDPSGVLNSTLILKKFHHSLPDWYLSHADNGVGPNLYPPEIRRPDVKATFIALYMDLKTFQLKEVKLDLTRFDLLSDWKNRGVPRENFEYLGKSDPSWKFLLDLIRPT